MSAVRLADGAPKPTYMNKKLVTTLTTITFLLAPVFALAWVPDALPNQWAPNVVPAEIINAIFNFIWPVVAAVVVIYFIIIAFMFFTAQGKPDDIATARKALIWGIAGVAIILMAFSMIAIVRFALNL